MLLESVVLACSRNITSNRTPSAIYHVITGKRSAQTMQDIHIYDLQNYYGIYPTLSNGAFQTLIGQLTQQHFLHLNENNFFQLTAHGEKWLFHQERSFSHEKFSGLKFHKLTSAFSNRLLLTIQTMANMMRRNFHFIPVVDNSAVQSWVKSWYNRIKSQMDYYRERLYQELDSILHTLTNQEASFFVDRLTGYKVYGMSSQQLAETYQYPVTDIPLIWTRIMHQLLETIHNDTGCYPMLYTFIDHESKQPFITATAKKTYQLLEQGHTVEMIASFRRLKVSTIYDHIVEIALVIPSFSITPFMDHTQYEKIAQAIGQTTNYSLKQLKELVDPEISYFQIRLVLATIKHK